LTRTNATLIISATTHGHRFYDTVSDPTFLRFLEDRRVIIKLPIKLIADRQVTFLDDSTQGVDEIILCTGYKFSYPFLPHQEVSEHWQYVNHLYKGIIDTKYPRIAHIGLHRGRTFMKAELTGKYLKKTWVLPADAEAMKRELQTDEEEMRSQGLALYRYYTAKFSNPNDILELCTRLGVTYDSQRFAELIELSLYNFIDVRTKFLSYKGEDYYTSKPQLSSAQ
jgi:hypothetical protein